MAGPRSFDLDLWGLLLKNLLQIYIVGTCGSNYLQFGAFCSVLEGMTS